MKKKLLFFLFFIFISINFFICADTLESGSFVTNWSFDHGNGAQGAVTVDGIATFPESGSVYVNVSAGGFRNIIAVDSTMTLSKDLNIFGTINTNSGADSYLRILGGDNIIGLSQSQTFSSLKVFGKDLTIDGNGNSLILSGTRVLRVEKNSYLHLKDCVVNIQNSDEALFLDFESSKLILEDCSLNLINNCYIDKGTLEFYGGVSIKTGNEKAFILSGGEHVIKSGCTVTVHPGVSFNLTPSTNSEQFLTFEDDTAQLVFNSATLVVDDSLNRILSDSNIVMKNDCNTNTIKKTKASKVRDTSLVYDGNVYGIDWSLDGKYLSTVGKDSNSTGSVCVYYYDDGILSFVTSAAIDDTTTCVAIAWSPDGNYLAVGGKSTSRDLSIYDFNGSSLNLIESVLWAGASHRIYSVGWHPEGQYIAAGGIGFNAGNEDGFIIYKFDGSSLITIGSKVRDKGYCLDWDPLGEYVAVGYEIGDPDYLEVYEFDASNEILYTSPIVTATHSSTFISTKWSSDGNYIASSHYTNEVEIYSFNRSVPSLTILPETSKSIGGSLYGLSWSSDDNYLAIGSWDNFLEVDRFNGESLSYVLGTTFENAANVNAISFLNNANTIAVGCDSGGVGSNLKLFNLDPITFEEVADIQLGSGQDYRASAWYENYFAISESGAIQIYTFDGDGNELTLLTTESITNCDEIYSLDWTYSGSYLAAGVYDLSGTSSLHIYKFENDILSLQDEQNYGSKLFSVKWSPIGNYIAIGGQDPNSGHDELEVYEFDGTNLNFSYSADFGNFISCVEWSSDGNYLAVTGDSGDDEKREFIIYLFESGSLTVTCSVDYGGNDKRGYSVAWSTDNQYVAIGGKPNAQHQEVEIYSVSGGQVSDSPVCSVNYGSYVTSVSWSPDGNYLVVGGVEPGDEHNNFEVYGFDGNDLTILFASQTDYQTHSDFESIINEIKWHSSSEYLSVVGIGNPDIHIYDFSCDIRGQNLGRSTFGDEVKSCDWSPDGQYLAVAGYDPDNAADEEVRIYSLPPTPGDNLISVTGLDYASGYDREAEVVCWSPDGNYLAIGGKHGGQDNRIMICEFDITTTPTLILKDNAYDNFDCVFTITWSPDGTHLAVGGLNSSDNDLYIYSFNGSLLTTVTYAPFGSELYELKWSGTGDYLVAVGWDGLRNKQCKIYSFDSVGESIDLAAEEEVASILMTVDWSADGQYLATGYRDLLVYYWNGSSLDQKYSDSVPYTIQSVRWSNDGNFLAVGGEDFSDVGEDMMIYQFNSDTESLYPIYQTRLFLPEPVYSLAWKFDNSALAVGGDGNYAVNVYEFNGDILGTNLDFDFYSSDSWGVADISPDGKYMALNYGGLRLYDVQNTATPTLISETNLTVNSNDIKWSPDGSYLIDVATDEKIYLRKFDNEIFELTDTYTTSGESLFCVDWSPDGRHVAAGIFGGTSENIITFSISNDDLHVTFSVDCCDSDNGIYSVHWTSSGSYLAVGGRNLNVNPTTTHDIRIYKFDSTSTESLAYVSGSVLSTSTIRSVNWNPDNIYLAAGGEDSATTGCLYLFKFNSINSSFSLLQTLAIDSEVAHVCWDDFGHYLVATRFDYTFDIYNLNRVSEELDLYSTTTFGGTRKPHVSWFPDGEYFVVAGKNVEDDSDVNIYNFSGSPLQQASEMNLGFSDASYVESIKWSSDSSYLAFGLCQSGSVGVGVYSFDSNKTLTILYGTQVNYGGHVRSIDWSSDGSFLAVGGAEPDNNHELQVYCFNRQNSLVLTTSKDYGSYIQTVAWAPNANYLAVGGASPTDNHELQIYYLNDNNYLETVTHKMYGNVIEGIAWSPDGNYLVVGGGVPDDGNELQIYEFNSTTSELTDKAEADFGDKIWTVAWSHTGNYIAIGGESPSGENEEVQVYYFDGSSLEFKSRVDFGTKVRSVDWSPDDYNIAISGQTASDDYEVRVYYFDGSSLSLATQMDYGDEGIAGSLSVAWSPEGDYLAVGGYLPNDDKEIKIYPIAETYTEIPETSDTPSEIEMIGATIDVSKGLSLENIKLKVK